MAVRKLQLAAFGLGRMGQVHLENLLNRHAAGQISLVAIGDRHSPTLERARALPALQEARMNQLPAYATPEDMIAGRALSQFSPGTGLDGVVISSRTEDHSRDSWSFVRHGIPVLVEKPFANTTAEACDFARVLDTLPCKGEALVQVRTLEGYLVS